MSLQYRRLSVVPLLFCLFLVACLTLTNMTPLPNTMAFDSRRPSLKRFDQIVKQSKGNRAAMLKALAEESITPRLKKICYVSPRGRVACIDAGEILNREVPQLADRNVLQLTLNDLMDVLGAAPGADVLAACGSSSMSGVTHLVPISADVGSSPAQMPGRIGVTGKGMGGLGAQTWSLSGSQAQSVTSACRNAQTNSIRGKLGAFTPMDAGYGGAVNNAVSTMDSAVQNCRESGNSMVSTPGSGNSQTPPANANTNSGGSNPGGNANSNSNQSGNSNSGNQNNQQQPTAPEAAVSVVNMAIGAAEAIVTTFGPAVGGASPTPAGVVGVVLGVVGIIAGGAELGTGSETAGTVGNVSQVASTLITVAEGAATGDIAAIVTTDAELLALGGEAGVAVGAEAAFFPVVAAGFAGYAGTRLVNEATGGAVDRGAVSAVGALSDAYFNWSNDIPSTGSGGAQRPSPEGGKPSCSSIQAAWNRFKSYCSQAGNNWQTYDCMLFVARMNGCADPGLINPAPDREYTCSAGCSRMGGMQKGRAYSGRGAAMRSSGMAGSSSACDQERLLAECENRERRRGMISMPAGGGEGRRVSCRDQINGMAGLQQQLRQRTSDEICKRASSDPNGLCGGQRSRRPGAENKTRQQ